MQGLLPLALQLQLQLQPLLPMNYASICSGEQAGAHCFPPSLPPCQIRLMQGVLALIEACLSPNPAHRPTAAQALLWLRADAASQS